MTLEPKPCPFCGSTTFDIEADPSYKWVAVRCGSCYAAGPGVRIKYQQTEEELHERMIESWNLREEQEHAT